MQKYNKNISLIVSIILLFGFLSCSKSKETKIDHELFLVDFITYEKQYFQHISFFMLTVKQFTKIINNPDIIDKDKMISDLNRLKNDLNVLFKEYSSITTNHRVTSAHHNLLINNLQICSQLLKNAMILLSSEDKIELENTLQSMTKQKKSSIEGFIEIEKSQVKMFEGAKKIIDDIPEYKKYFQSDDFKQIISSLNQQIKDNPTLEDDLKYYIKMCNDLIK